MLFGWYERPLGQPFFSAHVHIPRLAARGTIQFLFDTGADRTTIAPIDARRLGINYEKLENRQISWGIGGECTYFTEPMQVFFLEDDTVHEYEFPIDVLKPAKDTDRLPSLLGRDIIDHWHVTYKPSANELTAKVLWASRIMKTDQSEG